jgi:methionyl aminopeptidase
VGNSPLSLEEIKKMKKVCRMAAETLIYVERFVKPGVSLNELDKIVYDFTLSQNAVPATLGYHGYPKSICTSINQVVCHGVPNDYLLKEGDIVNIDVTTKFDGFFGDTSKTFAVGKISEEAQRLVQTAKEAMEVGIKAITPYGTTGDIGFEINKFVTRKGYSTVKEIGGHGIGRKFHQEPFVASIGKKGKGEKLVPNYCLTVEPMINEGTDEISEYPIPGSSHSQYETKDGKLSAQFEHTVLITDSGYEVLTLP